MPSIKLTKEQLENTKIVNKVLKINWDKINPLINPDELKIYYATLDEDHDMGCRQD
jgi:hypothetical protein